MGSRLRKVVKGVAGVAALGGVALGGYLLLKPVYFLNPQNIIQFHHFVTFAEWESEEERRRVRRTPERPFTYSSSTIGLAKN